MALVEVTVPDIGDFDEVAVIEVLVKPGDSVKAEQSLITVESDKASMEIPSSAAGVVKAIQVKLGDKIKQGSVVLTLESAEAAAALVTAPAASAAPAAPVSDTKPPVAPAEPARSASESVAPVAKPSAPAADSTVELRVPDIGDFKDVAVIELLVKVGDAVKLEQSLITVESDKASMEIPASAAGVIQELKVKLGDVVNVGDVLALLQSKAGEPVLWPATQTNESAAAPASPPAPTPMSPSADPAKAEPAANAPAPPPAVLPAHQPSTAPANVPHASPSIRKFARELGVPLAEVKGSGLKGRITQEDVQQFTQRVMAGTATTQAATQAIAKAASSAAPTHAAAGSGAGLNLLPWPKVDFTKFGPVERKDQSRIKKISAANLHRNWVMIPHVTNHDDADITELEAFRVQLNKEHEKAGIKFTMLAFLIKACVAALQKFPEFNASLDGEQLVLKQYFHVGFAADTPNGLMVPVLRDADTKSLTQIAKEMGELASKARDGKLSPAEMTGGCFSISSLGGIGGTYFTPIINAPEVAILGVCKSATKPVWDGEAFVPRLILPLSLSYDHRVIDGAAAARFNTYLAQVLGDFRRVLI